MRQVVSLIKDNQVHYALVDDDSGELIPFADVLLPDPDRFGLHEAAVLGTNLITTLGLNGHRPRKVAEVIAAETPALPAAPQSETAAERKRRRAREYYHEHYSKAAQARKETPAQRGRPRNDGQPSQNRVKVYIPREVVLNTINEHPEGGTCRQIAAWLSQTSEELVERWIVRTVENRVNAAIVAEREGIAPLPFRFDYVQGKRGRARMVYPIGGGSPA